MQIVNSNPMYNYDGILCQVHASYDAVSANVSVVRYLGAATQSHIYSTTEYEQNILNNSPVWAYEGVAWFGEST